MKSRDYLTPKQRSALMSRVRSRNTSVELQVRRLVRKMRLSYRLHRKDLPGRPDLVFDRKKKVIFVHGCFWHGHHCAAGKNRPRTKQTYWEPKLRRNVERDSENQIQLKKMGWRFLVIWECELKNEDKVRKRMTKYLKLKSKIASRKGNHS